MLVIWLIIFMKPNDMEQSVFQFNSAFYDAAFDWPSSKKHRRTYEDWFFGYFEVLPLPSRYDTHSYKPWWAPFVGAQFLGMFRFKNNEITEVYVVTLTGKVWVNKGRSVTGDCIILV